MPDRTLRAVLTGQSSGQVKAFQESGDAAEKSARRISESADKSSGNISHFGTSATGVFKGVAGALAGAFVIDKVVDFVKGGIEQNQIFAKNAAQTAAVIQSTGGAAHVTAQQVRDLSGSIEDATSIQQENVEAGENMLLTFTNIQNRAGKGNDIFNQSTHVLADMSTAMGTDMKDGAIQLGKALNDPIQGITALTRVGVTFSDEQKKQIENFEKAGDMASAQKVILGELNKEFGGSAEALGKSPASAVARLQDKFQDMAAALVGKVAPALLAALPAVGKLADFIGNVLGKAIDFVGPLIGGLVNVVSDIVGSFEAGASITDNIAGAFETLGEEIGIFGKGSAAGMGMFKGALETIKSIVSTVFGVIGADVQEAVGVFNREIKPLATKLMPVVGQAFQGIAGIAKDVFPVVAKLAETAFHLIATIVGSVVHSVSTLWDRFGTQIIATVKGIAAVAVPVFKVIATVLADIFGWVADKIPGAFQFMTDFITNAVNVIAGTIGVIATVITTVGTVIGTVVSAIIDVIKTIAPPIQWVAGVIGTVLGGVFGFIAKVVETDIGIVVAIIKGIVGAVQAISGPIGSVFHAIADVVTTIFKGIATAIGHVMDGVIGVVKGIIDIPIRVVNGVIDAVNGIKVKVPDWVPGIGGKGWDGLHINHLPMLDTGGIVQQAGLAYLHPAEVIVNPQQQAMAMVGNGGGGRNITIHNTYTLNGNDERLLAQFKKIVDDNTEALEKAISKAA